MGEKTFTELFCNFYKLFTQLFPFFLELSPNKMMNVSTRCFLLWDKSPNETFCTKGSRSQCKGGTNGSYLYGGAGFGSGMSGGIYPGGAGGSYASYPQSYNQEYQYSTPFQPSAASTSAYYGHPAASASSYYYNPSPSTSSTTPTTFPTTSNPPIPGNINHQLLITHIQINCLRFIGFNIIH